MRKSILCIEEGDCQSLSKRKWNVGDKLSGDDGVLQFSFHGAVTLRTGGNGIYYGIIGCRGEGKKGGPAQNPNSMIPRPQYFSRTKAETVSDWNPIPPIRPEPGETSILFFTSKFI